jgi:hypothetical protein
MIWDILHITKCDWSWPVAVALEDTSERGFNACDGCVAAFNDVLEKGCDHEVGRTTTSETALVSALPGCDVYNWSNTTMLLDDRSTNVDNNVVVVDQLYGAASAHSALGWETRTTNATAMTTARTLAYHRTRPDCTLPGGVRDDEIIFVFKNCPFIELQAFRSQALHLEYIKQFIGQPAANSAKHHGYSIFLQLSCVSEGYGFRILQVIAYAAEVYRLGRDFIERLQHTREFLILVTNIVALMPERYSEVRDAFRQGCSAVFRDFHKGRLTKNGGTSTAIKFFRMLWIVLARASIDTLLDKVMLAIDNELFLKNDSGHLLVVRTFYQDIINNGGAGHVYSKIENKANLMANRDRETRIDVSSAHRAAIANNTRKEVLFSGIDEFLTSLAAHYQAATNGRPACDIQQPPRTSQKDTGALTPSA